MNGWLLLALVLAGCVVVALAILLTDVARGDVGGGRHTLERARRLLVVATDEAICHGAERWIDERRAERPDAQYFVLCEPDADALFLSVEDAIERERPDAVIIARAAAERHATIEGLYGALKEEGRLPVDAIYVEPARA